MEDQELIYSAGESWIFPYVNFLFWAGLACLIFLIARFYSRPRETHLGKVNAWTINWLNFGMFLWLMFISVFLTGLILNTIGSGGRQEGDYHSGGVWEIVLGGISMQGGMMLVFLFYLKYHPELFRHKMNATHLPALKALFVGVLLFLSAFPVIFLVGLSWQVILDQLVKIGLNFPQEPQELVYHLSQKIPYLARLSLILMATVTAPIVEEVVFRGAIYRFLKSRMNPAVAILASSCIFASIHFNLVSFPSLIVLGAFLCIAYEMTGNLKAPIFLHAIFNTNSLILISYNDELMEMDYAALSGIFLFF